MRVGGEGWQSFFFFFLPTSEPPVDGCFTGQIPGLFFLDIITGAGRDPKKKIINIILRYFER